MSSHDEMSDLERKAFLRWLEFSRAQEMADANIRDGRQARNPYDRWERDVSWKVKQQFMDEARYD